MSEIIDKCFTSEGDKQAFVEAGLEVHGFLRRLGEGDESEQRGIWMELSERSLHDVLTSILFVISLIQWPEVKSKAYLLYVLADYMQVNEGEPASADRASMLASIRERCLLGVPVYQQCLASSDSEIRVEASRALGASLDRHVVPSLVEQLAKETEVDVLVAILHALGHLKAVEAATTIKGFLESKEPLIQARAAMTLIRLSPDEHSPQHLNVLIDAFLMIGQRKEDHGHAYETFKFLQKLGGHVLSQAVDRWVERIGRADEKEVTGFVRTLLVFLFPGKTYPRREAQPIDVTKLSVMQIRVVQAIAENQHLWKAREVEIQQRSESPYPSERFSEPTLDWHLDNCGLPTDREELIRVARSRPV